MYREIHTLVDKAWRAASNKNNWLTIGSHNLTSLSDEHVKSILSSGDHAQYDIPSEWPDSVAATSKVWSIKLDHVSIQKSSSAAKPFLCFLFTHCHIPYYTSLIFWYWRKVLSIVRKSDVPYFIRVLLQNLDCLGWKALCSKSRHIRWTK